MQNENTEKLMNEIKESKNLYQYIRKYDASFQDTPFRDFIQRIMKAKNLSKSKVIKESNLHRTYAYQILAGKKQPSRDKILKLSYGLNLTIDETQELLKIAKYNTLYPKNKRDAIIIYSKCYQLDLIQTNNLLYNNQEKVLE